MAYFGRKTQMDTAAKLSKSDGDKTHTMVRKGLYEVGTLGRIISDLSYLARTVAYEAQREGDGSTQATDLKATIDSLCDQLKAMAAEEAEEMKASTLPDDSLTDAACSAPYPYY
jgi:hypothetical protein